jgi:hypothetical protein
MSRTGTICMTVEEEIELGSKAQRAYSTYLADYIVKKNEDLYKQFLFTDDIQSLRLIKAQQKALQIIENDITSDIETGQLAQLQKGN